MTGKSQGSSCFAYAMQTGRENETGVHWNGLPCAWTRHTVESVATNSRRPSGFPRSHPSFLEACLQTIAWLCEVSHADVLMVLESQTVCCVHTTQLPCVNKVSY